MKKALFRLWVWIKKLFARKVDVETLGDVKTNSVGIYDEEVIYPDCTVQIWRNSVTGEESVGWWKNGS